MQIQNKKVLITGCGGMLGNAIYPYFKERASELLPIDIVIEEHEKDWLKYLDIREPDQLKQAFKDFQPDLGPLALFSVCPGNFDIWGLHA